MRLLDVGIYASRKLKDSQNYLDFSNVSKNLEAITSDVKKFLEIQDEVVGCYYSFDGQNVIRIFVSLNGLYVEKRKSFQFIPYKRIKNIILPDEKLNAFRFRIILEDDESVDLIISGFKIDLMGRMFFDLFAFSTFMGHLLNRNFNKNLTEEV